MTLMHTELNNVNVPLYYVYGISDGGFVIASADDRAVSLLGYTDNGDFETATLNPAFKSWLADCIGVLNWLSEQPEGTLQSNVAATRAETLTPVAPLLGDIMWDQNAPYNNKTPMRKNSKGEMVQAPTGCVATAIAQVMMYHQWPDKGTGKHTNETDPSQTVNFAESTYNWAAMKAKYKKDYTEAAAAAVAKLMADIGCAVDMNYGANDSGANDYGLMKGLAYYLRYNKALSRQIRNYYTTESWNQLLRSELDKKLPVLYGGSVSSGGGHQFVLDGYDANGLYHVNWGWGGSGNGYFDINVLDPKFQGIGGFAGGYVIGQTAIIGVKPDKDNSTVAKPQVEIYQEIDYNLQENEFTVYVSNHGLGDFKGEIGFVLEEPSGKKELFPCLKGSKTDMSFTKAYKLRYTPKAVSSTGYTVYTYYSDTEGGETKALPTPVSAITRMGSYYNDDLKKWTWGTWADDRANLKFSNLVATRNYAKFKPKFKVHVEKPSTDLNEYGDLVNIQVWTTIAGRDTVICQGKSQLFISPGEKKDLEIECDYDAKNQQFNGDIKEGEYQVKLSYQSGGYNYTPNYLSETVTIVKSEPGNLSHSDFVVDQANGKIEQGEALTASMIVKNTGGFDMQEYFLFVFPITGGNSLDYAESKPELLEKTTTKVSFYQILNLDPGKYFCMFYIREPEGNKKLSEKQFVFEVVEATTALDEVQKPADIKAAQLYDLNGRPVTDLKKGGLYIGKTKVIVR